jgi:hypothetical protein
MATSTTTITAITERDVLNLGRAYIIVGTFVVNAGDYAAGGLVLDFTAMGLKVPTSRKPLKVFVSPRSSGWEASYVPGTTLANGKVKFYGQTPTSATASTIPLDEMPVAAAPASITSDAIDFMAVFVKNL